jgi:hypothetical protein
MLESDLGVRQNIMRDNKVIARFNTYLNAALFKCQDPFIRRKYKAYLKQIG